MSDDCGIRNSDCGLVNMLSVRLIRSISSISSISSVPISSHTSTKTAQASLTGRLNIPVKALKRGVTPGNTVSPAGRGNADRQRGTENFGLRIADCACLPAACRQGLRSSPRGKPDVISDFSFESNRKRIEDFKS
jgi:hypothetical protein